jgi:hypothetical protein
VRPWARAPITSCSPHDRRLVGAQLVAPGPLDDREPPRQIQAIQQRLHDLDRLGRGHGERDAGAGERGEQLGDAGERRDVLGGGRAAAVAAQQLLDLGLGHVGRQRARDGVRRRAHEGTDLLHRRGRPSDGAEGLGPAAGDAGERIHQAAVEVEQQRAAVERHP